MGTPDSVLSGVCVARFKCVTSRQFSEGPELLCYAPEYRNRNVGVVSFCVKKEKNLIHNRAWLGIQKFELN